MAKNSAAKAKKIKEKKLSRNKALLEECRALLSECRYFHTITEENLRSVLENGTYMEVPEGSCLIRYGSADDDIYILLEGALSVRAGGEQLLLLSRPGDVAGEFAMISSEPRSADVYAEADSRVVQVSSAVAKIDPESQSIVAQLLMVFSHIMAAKLRETSSRARLYEATVLQAQDLATSHEKLQEDIEDKLKEITLYSKVIETSNDAVVITESWGRIARFNQAAVKLFPVLQRKKHEVSFDTICKPYDMGEFPDLELGTPWRGEWSRPLDNKEDPLVLQVTVTPIFDEKQRLVAVAHQFRDISLEKSQARAIELKNEEIQRALVDLESTYQELQKSDKLKSETLTVISDELAGPVRKLTNFSEQLVQEMAELPEVQSSANLIGIEEQSAYLKAMSENISNLIDIQHNYQAVSAEIFDLKSVLFRVEEELGPLALRKSMDLELEVPPDIMDFTGDERQVKMVLGLLIEQAIATGIESSTVNIIAETVPATQQYHLSIKYNGPSLSNLRPSEDTAGGRFGLLVGLPLARKVIAFYQGSLQLQGDSKTGEISILLPHTQKSAQDRANRIFIVDEQDMDRLIVQGVIEHLWPDAVLYVTSDPFEFLDNYEDFKPDLVIVDPDLTTTGWGNHRIIGSLTSNRRHICPILSLSALYQDFSERSIAVERGVSDFLEKPYSIFDVRFKVKTLLQSHRKEETLHHTMDLAQRQAHTDGLTKLANRKHFDGFLETQVNYALETGKPCSMILLDIDNFKHYNDTHGHQMGDEVLKAVAKVLTANVRSSDLAARYGGEEFALVLPETSKELAAVVAEKVRRALNVADIPKATEQPLGVMSASFGVATIDEDGVTGEELIKASDDCLYRAKDLGRNCVVLAGESAPRKAKIS